ncbi:MAG: YMGG-like glycine zipper-containing protein [Burkholderiales bacterium]
MKRRIVPLLAVALFAAGCTTIPTGPSRMALPGSGKDFDSFRMDDASCRQYALQVSGATPTETQENSAVKSAVVGTAVGAVAGAAIGGSSRGAATGAGVGLLMGALAGASAGDQSGYVVQRRYDNGYVQCMYAKGHRVPVAGGMSQQAQVQPAPQQPYYAPQYSPQPPAPTYNPPPPQQQQYYAPPPPGSAPPPPSAIVR